MQGSRQHIHLGQLIGFLTWFRPPIGLFLLLDASEVVSPLM